MREFEVSKVEKEREREREIRREEIEK